MFEDQVHRNPRRQPPQLAPDDLDDKSLADVLALKRFMVSNRVTFVDGAVSTAVALDLEHLGLVKLRRFRSHGLRLMEVIR
jgi:hypothetical protein